LEGGLADYFDGTNARVLNAGRFIQPLIHAIRMPGFLGLIQPLLRMVTPKYIQLQFFVGQKPVFTAWTIEPEMFQVHLQGQKHGLDDQPIWDHLYKRSELASAIEQFLQGAPPTAQVRLWRAQ
jgi:hypothetical protein